LGIVETTGETSIRRAGTAPLAVFAVAFVCAVLAVFASAAPASASSGLDATTIDAFLAAQGSPMAGTGATFVAEAAEHGVDPAFLVAVAGAESSFGLYLYAPGGDAATYNAFNWFYTSPRSDADFGSWDEAIAALAAGIAGDLYYGSGLFSIYEIGPRYCPEGTSNWLTNVALFMERLGGDPLDTRWTGGEPPTVDAAQLQLDGRVELSRPPRVVGETVEARFTIANTGFAAIQVEDVRLAVRDSSGAAYDLGAPGSLVLAPGESREFLGSWALTTLGRWYGWIELRYGDQRVLLGDAQAFAFSANLPRDPRVARRWVIDQLALAPSS
jgi:hypothetical protein